MKNLRCLLGFHKWEYQLGFSGMYELRRCILCGTMPQVKTSGSTFWAKCGEGATWNLLLKEEDYYKADEEYCRGKISIDDLEVKWNNLEKEHQRSLNRKGG